MNKKRIGLVVQLFFFIILPLAGLLLLFSFGSVFVHQNEMRNMVGERDALAARAAAETLDAAIARRTSDLHALALRAAESANAPQSILDDSISLSDEFNLGLALVSSDGHLLASRNWSPDLPSPVDLIDNDFQTIQLPNERLAAILARKSPDGQVTGVGAFALSSLFQKTFEPILPPNPEVRIFIVDSSRNLLYQNAELDFKDEAGQHPGVEEALRGDSGTLYIDAGTEEHVVAYAPVAGWALVLEEPWQAAINPLLNTSQVGPLVMAPLLLVMLVALWFGARQIIQPLQALEMKAARLANGDFTDIEKSVGGIAEIRHLQSELVSMAAKLQAAQQSLHDYIGVITSAQEDERRRLARELHDDTLQALIALQQRLQLAQMANASPTRASLREVQDLTEETIQNLRRMMRALRPIYLDDLGLVPALEMLAREANQTTLHVDFRCDGKIRRLDAIVELALYRMAQEALSNITKHATATKASLAITFAAGSVSLNVHDDGIGFDLPQTSGAFASQGHFGLLGLHERADLIGAKLEIKSRRGAGTHVQITVQILG